MSDHDDDSGDDSAVDWVRRLARIGWLSKGFVFIVIGVLAIQIALTDWNGNGSEADADQEGALQAVADQPFGVGLLTATAIGLALFMVWNLAQAFIPDSTDLDLLGIIQRIGWFGLGLFYGFLAFTGLRLAWTEANAGDGGGAAENGDDETEPEELTARLFELPGGRWIAGLIAIGVLVVAGYHLYKGVSRQFVDDLDTDGLSDSQETWLGRFGVVGFAARAFVLAATAWFLAQAAINYDPDEAEGLDGALRELASVVYGQILLVVVGLGLVFAGGYDMVTFRRQRLR
jgi:hypothetical protein